MNVRLLAYAKLNLDLHIVGRRPDGFHNLVSTVQTIDLADEITIRLAGGDVSVRNDALSDEGPDLAERAVRALLSRKGVTCGVSIDVCKRIPIGGGLGGGSSDAAAVLLAMNRLLDPVLSSTVLARVGATLGSDVPLFLQGGLLRMEGRGERITALGNPRSETFVVLCPPLQCDTAMVYANWKKDGGTGAFDGCLGTNDLLAPALTAYPGLTKYHDAMSRLNAAYFGMSGSGASMFGAFEAGDEAALAADRLRQRIPEAVTFICRATSVGSRIVEGGGR